MGVGCAWGFTLILAWIPAFAGMTGQGAGMRVPAFAGTTGAFCSFLVISATYLTSAARGCSGVIRSGPLPYLGPIWPDLPLAAGTGAIRGVERSSGVRRSGKLLIRFRLVPFRSIPIPRTLILTFSQRAKGSAGVRRSSETFNFRSFPLISAHSSRRLGLGFHPHPILLPSREKGPDRLHGNDGRNLGRWRHRRD